MCLGEGELCRSLRFAVQQLGCGAKTQSWVSSPGLVLTGALPGWQPWAARSGEQRRHGGDAPWLAKPFLRVLGCAAGPLGGRPVRAALWFGVGGSQPLPQVSPYALWG